jgi:hypothetical protein
MKISRVHSLPSGQLPFEEDKNNSAQFSTARNRENQAPDFSAFALIALRPQVLPQASICWSREPTSGIFRNCWDTKAAKPPKSIRMSAKIVYSKLEASSMIYENRDKSVLSNKTLLCCAYSPEIACKAQ